MGSSPWGACLQPRQVSRGPEGGHVRRRQRGGVGVALQRGVVGCEHEVDGQRHMLQGSEGKCARLSGGRPEGMQEGIVGGADGMKSDGTCWDGMKQDGTGWAGWDMIGHDGTGWDRMGQDGTG